jgi:hypothetical protein
LQAASLALACKREFVRESAGLCRPVLDALPGMLSYRFAAAAVRPSIPSCTWADSIAAAYRAPALEFPMLIPARKYPHHVDRHSR